MTAGCRVENAQFVEQVASLFTKEELVVVVGRIHLFICIFHSCSSKNNNNTQANNVNLQGCQSGKRSEQACVDLQAAVCMYVRTYGQRETAECLPLPAGVQERQEHGRRLPCLAPPWMGSPSTTAPTNRRRQAKTPSMQAAAAQAQPSKLQSPIQSDINKMK